MTHTEGVTGDAHPSEAQYIRIAAILAVITAVEVALYYWNLGAANNYALLLLAAVKFAMVGMFFMHLRFDSRILRRLFVTGIVLASFCYLAVLFMFHVFP